jgi:hypothetical protein
MSSLQEWKLGKENLERSLIWHMSLVGTRQTEQNCKTDDNLAMRIFDSWQSGIYVSKGKSLRVQNRLNVIQQAWFL